MNLSLLFLRVLNGDFSRKSVKSAVETCNQELLSRLGTTGNEIDIEKVFFNDQEREYGVSDFFLELMDFWDTYEQFDHLLTKNEKKNFEIMYIIFEADGVYQLRKNEKLIQELAEKERIRLQELCREIEGIYNAKKISFFLKEKDGMILRYQMPLDEFEESLLSFNYVAVQNRLIELIKSEGLAVVTAGSKGLTPQRMHGFITAENGWFSCPENVLKQVQDIVITENKERLVNSRLKGVN